MHPTGTGQPGKSRPRGVVPWLRRAPRRRAPPREFRAARSPPCAVPGRWRDADRSVEPLIQAWSRCHQPWPFASEKTSRSYFVNGSPKIELGRARLDLPRTAPRARRDCATAPSGVGELLVAQPAGRTCRPPGPRCFRDWSLRPPACHTPWLRCTAVQTLHTSTATHTPTPGDTTRPAPVIETFVEFDAFNSRAALTNHVQRRRRQAHSVGCARRTASRAMRHACGRPWLPQRRCPASAPRRGISWNTDQSTPLGITRATHRLDSLVAALTPTLSCVIEVSNSRHIDAELQHAPVQRRRRRASSMAEPVHDPDHRVAATPAVTGCPRGR